MHMSGAFSILLHGWQRIGSIGSIWLHTCKVRCDIGPDQTLPSLPCLACATRQLERIVQPHDQPSCTDSKLIQDGQCLLYSTMLEQSTGTTRTREEEPSLLLLSTLNLSSLAVEPLHCDSQAQAQAHALMVVSATTGAARHVRFCPCPLLLRILKRNGLDTWQTLHTIRPALALILCQLALMVVNPHPTEANRGQMLTVDGPCHMLNCFCFHFCGVRRLPYIPITVLCG